MRMAKEEIVSLARRCGFPYARLWPARPIAFSHHPESLRQGIVEDPASVMPGARSILLLLWPYPWHTKWPAKNGEVSAFYFASQRAHAALGALARALRARGVAVSESQALPKKLLFASASLGRVGRNTLLRNDRWGSSHALQILLTDLEADESRDEPPLSASACGSCQRCVQACPTQALDGEGNLDVSRCLRTYMLSGKVVPEALREKMGARLLGCEVCQRACPHNRVVEMVAPPAEESFSMAALLEGKRAAVQDIATRIGVNYARKERLQAQAALCAGNSGDISLLPYLEPLARHERPAIALHAGWAMQRLTKL